MKKLKIIIIIVILLLLTLGAGYLQSFRLPVESIRQELVQEPPAGVTLGEPVRLAWHVTLPLARTIESVQVEAPATTVAVGEATATMQRYQWNRAVWRVAATLRPLRPGETKPGKAVLNLSLWNGERRTLTLEIPKMTILPLSETSDDLALAGEVEPSIDRRPVAWLIGIGVALALLAALLVWRMVRSRRQEREAEIPPWMRAAAELAELKREVKANRIDFTRAFTRLTDVVRNYLERRYAIPASKRTTEEFLETLHASENPVPEPERPFLRKFLEAAELVKFANLPPAEDQLLRAVEGAEELVAKTVPEIEEVKHV